MKKSFVALALLAAAAALSFPAAAHDPPGAQAAPATAQLHAKADLSVPVATAPIAAKECAFLVRAHAQSPVLYPSSTVARLCGESFQRASAGPAQGLTQRAREPGGLGLKPTQWFRAPGGSNSASYRT